MQALHLLALEPIAESTLEPNYYGFRPFRSTADVIGQCFNCLAQRNSVQWILEGDIKSCFDKISHDWLINNINMDKQVLNKWLKSGIIDKKKFCSINMGTQQGSVISPTLANLTLNGMESLLKDIPRKHKVNIVIYADDFVVTANSKEILQELVKPKIESFLQKRGLELSKEKTSLTHINKGFDFLGFNIRKYNGKLLIKPSKSSIKDFLSNIRDTVKTNKVTTEKLIYLLNPKIRGWANYYRHVVAKKTFSYIDNKIFWTLIDWTRRLHPNKSTSWMNKKYFRSDSSRIWIFHAKTKNQEKVSYLDLVYAGKIPIIRHVKIRGHANPFDPVYKKYFENRKIKRIFSGVKKRFR